MARAAPPERPPARDLGPAAEIVRGDRWSVQLDDVPTGAEVFAHSIARGLSDHPRWLHCRYLYDAEGSRIFLEITKQPEYYPTRAEAEILAARADAIRAAAGPVPIVELGAGAALKTRRLLEAWSRADGPVEYVPIDIDGTVLVEAARGLVEAFDDVTVTGLATSYERGLEAVAGASPMCLVFLGSTIGNLNPEETDDFLARVERTLAPRDTFLLGVDLVKDVDTLEAAYDDAAGWSAAFTRNLFARMNRELGTCVDPATVEHVAYWNDRLERIEIHARFLAPAVIDLAAIGRRFRVARGEMVLTEISRKYRIPRIETDLARFGFRLEERFVDDAGRFALLLFRRAETGNAPTRRARLAAELQGVRRRTHELLESLTDEQIRRAVVPYLSPIAWDLAHIAEFEDLWLVRTLDARAGGGAEAGALAAELDASATPREARAALELPGRDEILGRLRRVRRESLARLERTAEGGGDPLVAGGFVWTMLAQHEAQHQETALQAIALMDDLAYEPAFREATPRPTLPPDTAAVLVPAGPFRMGAGSDTAAYDNERPRHRVELGAFWLDSAPVTNARYLAFVEDGGYARKDAWSAEGWEWLANEGARHPLGWRPAEGGWEEVAFGRAGPLVPDRPVLHVSWYEADAFARWAGARLPTEAEWEKAAAWDPEARVPRRWPWGDRAPDPRRANLDARLFGPAPVGAYPEGRSFYGCHQMVGDVWEWTSSWFRPYPGFAAFPYAEYSEIHFGEWYRVLRGGSWATSAIVARTTFRNWDWPYRRQIFAGFRCARDA